MVQPLSRRAFLGVGAGMIGALAGVASITAGVSRARPNNQTHALGELTLLAQSDPWRLSLLGPGSTVLWEEALDQTLSYRTNDGQTFHARRMASCADIGGGAIQMVAETDDPLG
ncbi:MAG TPA: hypothetical protein VFG86_02435, partial [Chloroflexota bacterium]|nr:hypothetical protein [Chloroflexota bacterium]